MNKGFTITCNNCGKQVTINKNNDTFGSWRYEYNKDKKSDISIENLPLSEAVEIICKCGNYVTEDESLGSNHRE